MLEARETQLISGPEVMKITFQYMIGFSDFADRQKWGVATSRGWQQGLGMGKCTDAAYFRDCVGLRNTQMWMRNFLASLSNCMPDELCWQPDGASCKAGPKQLL